MKEKRKLLMELFTSTLYLSAFTFGGGYVIVSLLKERFVDQLHYIDEKEMLDLVAIAQSAPGAIAVNGAIVLGYKMAGILGIIVCVIGTIIPPIVIISVIAYFYKIFITNKIISAMLLGMRAGIGAIIVSVVYDMALSVMDEHHGRNILIMIVSFVLNYFFNINIMYIILGCILLAIIDLVMRRERA
ncbi:MAG: chromate transporter [Coprobacillus sp.]|nr:chromate transporter [Coprobacillus sp.]